MLALHIQPSDSLCKWRRAPKTTQADQKIQQTTFGFSDKSVPIHAEFLLEMNSIERIRFVGHLVSEHSQRVKYISMKQFANQEMSSDPIWRNLSWRSELNSRQAESTLCLQVIPIWQEHFEQ